MKLLNVVSWLLTLLTPIILILVSVRLLMTPIFLQIEYNLPGFPDDYYGFTKQERLYWSRFAVDYLINQEGISYLGDLSSENGDPLYNERELKHMVDVKNVVRPAMLIMNILLLIFIGCGIWAWRTGWRVDFWSSLARGGWLTVVVFTTLMIAVLIGFNTVFVSFHNIFFDPGTWVFYYSDTLIRLFPMRFWQVAFVFIGVFCLLGGLSLARVFQYRQFRK
ncbi:MAG: TIGR01906 family membrane protein [Anaerolineales bacterium]|nr:TIGR01906 family membrane protein [Anaerolineales bacterium]